MAKGEERCNLHALIVAVSNVDSFAVDHFHVLTRPIAECWVIFEPPWKCGL
jgi:hypothetical protein